MFSHLLIFRMDCFWHQLKLVLNSNHFFLSIFKFKAKILKLLDWAAALYKPLVYLTKMYLEFPSVCCTNIKKIVSCKHVYLLHRRDWTHSSCLSFFSFYSMYNGPWFIYMFIKNEFAPICGKTLQNNVAIKMHQSPF